MTYERNESVLVVDPGVIDIKLDEVLQRKLAAQAVGRPVSSFHRSGAV